MEGEETSLLLYSCQENGIITLLSRKWNDYIVVKKTSIAVYVFLIFFREENLEILKIYIPQYSECLFCVEPIRCVCVCD